MASPLPVPQDTPDPDFAELLARRPHLTAHVLDGLVMEDVPLVRIAREVGTPSWVYSAGTLRRRYGALRDALAEVLADPELRVRMGEEGRERFRRVFSHERMLDRLSALYLGQARARRGSPVRSRRTPVRGRTP